MNKKIRALGVLGLVILWVVLAAIAWLGPRQAFSDTERRSLAQFPTLSADALFSGDFMTDFEDYALDQFPLRDTFRRLKALFHYNVLRQRDNNGIYIADGYAAEMEHPLDEGSVEHALTQFNKVYELYLKDQGSTVFSAVVPDKGYYLAEEKGYLSMDYDKLFSMMADGMPWATQVDLTGSLTLEDYYRTDTHWRQERLLPVAETLCKAMGITAHREGTLTATALERPFYGVYYGQTALPMEPETLYTLEGELLSGCSTYLIEMDAAGNPTKTKLYSSVYDMEKAEGKDLYETYLSGAQSVLRIENPNAGTDRELILFRDSYGSSLAPLLLQDYSAVTLVDIRYIRPELLDRVLDFRGQDVLFLYSTLVLNKNLI